MENAEVVEATHPQSVPLHDVERPLDVLIAIRDEYARGHSEVLRETAEAPLEGFFVFASYQADGEDDCLARRENNF